MLGWEVIPRIGPVSLHGVGIMIGYLVGAYIMARRARARGFDEDKVWTAASWAVVGAILGARIAYVVGHYDEFPSPLEWLYIWRGGISIVGGLMGGWSAAYLYARRAGVDFWYLADLAAPGLAIGIAVGRSGDLAIGDHLGKETGGWWGWQYQGGELISSPCGVGAYTPDYCVNGEVPVGTVVHQTAIYDSIWSLFILGALVILERTPRRRGFMALAWASMYALGRIGTDFLRVDKTWLGIGLTGSQLTSIVVLGLAIFLIVRYGGVPGRTADAVAGPGIAEAPAAAETVSVEAGFEEEPTVQGEPEELVLLEESEDLVLEADENLEEEAERP